MILNVTSGFVKHLHMDSLTELSLIIFIITYVANYVTAYVHSYIIIFITIYKNRTRLYSKIKINVYLIVSFFHGYSYAVNI